MNSFKVKSIIKRTFIVLSVAAVGIQFFHPAKNNDATIGANHISKMYTVPANVDVILQKACYDCHSNYTKYPWYNNIQPVNWWLNDHIVEAKDELNFSEFGTYKLLRQSKKLKKSAKEIEEGEMPLSSYTLIHRDAILTPEEKQAVIGWLNALSQEIYAKVTPAEIEEDRKRQEERKKQREQQGK